MSLTIGLYIKPAVRYLLRISWSTHKAKVFSWSAQLQVYHVMTFFSTTGTQSPQRESKRTWI